MKKWSRLTALMLAFVIMFSNVSGALAAVEVDYEALMQWIQSVKEANGLGDVIWLDRGGVPVKLPSFEPTTEGPQYSSTSDFYLASYANEEDMVTLDVPLSTYGKVNLIAPAAGQWLVYLRDAHTWVPVLNELSSTFVLTYAKVESLFMANGEALLCCAMADGATQIVNVQMQPETGTLELLEDDFAQASTPAMANESSMAYAAVPADESDSNTHYVIVNYVFRDGRTAASSWTAKLGEDSDLIQTVESPYVMGYSPDQASVDIKVTQIREDKIYTVTYYPAEVEFTVIHYKQNVDNDGYTEVERTTETGVTEDPVGKGLAQTYDGFYALLYDESVAIAADSSTEVEIYYDRHYYLMNFDLDGGYGVDPIYARFGTAIGEVGTPVNAGYEFAGWEVDGTPVSTLPTKMPAQNITYTAKWIGKPVTFTVVYWYENADDAHFTQAGAQYNVAATAGSIVNGDTYKDYAFEDRDDQHFTYAFADSDVKVSGDGSTVVNVYFRRNVYKMTFVIGSGANGCTVEQHRHEATDGEDSCYGLDCDIPEHNHVTDNCPIVCGHTHTYQCYRGAQSSVPGLLNDVFNNLKDNYPNPESGKVYSQRGIFGTYYFLYLNGNWYYLENQTSAILQCSHTHSSACYGCNQIEHEHTEAAGCYAGLICEKDEHYHQNGTCYLIIYRKYDADITGIWNRNPVKAVIDAGDAFNSSLTGMQYSFLEKMPGSDITMTKYDYSGRYTYRWYYYLEALPGQDTTGMTTRKGPDGDTYYLYKTSSLHSDGLSLTYDEDYFPITGFSQYYKKGEGGWTRDGSIYKLSFDNNREAYLYYTRNSYDLTFSNYGDVIEDEGGTFLYEEDISDTYFEPPYPTGSLEADSYVFEGWYTSPFYGDTRFEFTTKDENGNTVNTTMPAQDVTLYSRWVPVDHDVNFYLTVNDDGTYGNKVGETQTVPHRTMAADPYSGTEPVHPATTEYIFVGWFYKDGDTEKAFNFSMPIRQDMDLYAKWSSNVLLPYTIHYELADGTPVASDSTGSALAGTTKTFEAKYDELLNEQYRTGYFPHTNSHSLTIDIVDKTKNEFTFIYTPMDKVPYTVLYLEYDGDKVYDGTEKQLLAPKVVSDNKATIVTEQFKPITGYMPDAYQKRLVVSANPEENVIIFWYAKDNVHAPVQVIHYIQNAEGDGYTEYQSYTDLNGLIGQLYSTNVLTINGYYFDHATANKNATTAVDGKVTETVTASGLLLELYYNRTLYPYEFRFLEQGTEKKLADPVTGKARYDSQVTQSKKTIPGYTCSAEVQEIRIRTEEDTETAVYNVRTFYYTENWVTINYEVVGPDNCGTLDSYAETIKAVTQDATGSTPTANPAYKFVGWYKDAACSIPVSADWVDENNKLVPQKVNGVHVETTYYAKFDYNLTTLTIKKSCLQDIDAGQSFLFKVEGYGLPEGGLLIAINGNGSETISGLTVGQSYTVTEVENWSWRYTAEPKSITLTSTPSENKVEMVNTRDQIYWLSGDCYEENVFGEPSGN